MNKKIEAAVSHMGYIYLFVEGGEVFQMEIANEYTSRRGRAYNIRKLDNLPEEVTLKGR